VKPAATFSSLIRCALLAALSAVALAVPAEAAYAPQGGRWQADGSGPTYRLGMKTTRPTGHAIGQYQRLLRVPITYRYDRRTAHAVLHHQQRYRSLRNTGRIDFPTSRSLFAPIIRREAQRAGTSARALCGHLWAESRLDPGAVGPGGIDYGIGQIVPRYRPGTKAWDAQASIARMAQDDAAGMRRYGAWGQVAWWSPRQARAAAAGRPSRDAVAYRQRIAAAPCSGFSGTVSR
jgi:hypothetical protein